MDFGGKLGSKINQKSIQKGIEKTIEKRRRLGGVLEASWAVLEASWRHLGPNKPTAMGLLGGSGRIRVGL